MPDLADDLSKALAQAGAKKPCKCHEHEADPFGAGVAATAGDLGADLDAALGALGAAGADDLFAPFATDLEAELAFSDVSEAPGITLEQILEVLESRPGLKITLSY